MGLVISSEQSGDMRILRLKGIVDNQTLPSLLTELQTLFGAQHRKVLLDCTHVVKANSECLQMLLSETKIFSGGRGALGLINISSDLMKVIQNTGLERFLLIFRDEQEAIGAMR